MYVTRENQREIFKSFDSPFISALLGPRRTGKTTLVQHYQDQHPHQKWVNLNMDIRAQRGRVESDQLEPFIEETARQKIDAAHPIWVAIDEAQKCPALFEQIKVLYDRHKGGGAFKFILTGSGFLSLHQLAAETLAGRIQLFNLKEFNLDEAVVLLSGTSPDTPSLFDTLVEEKTVSQLQEALSQRVPYREPRESALVEQMLWGGLPEVLEFSDFDDRKTYLRDYLQTYLEKDIRAIGTISDLRLYERLLEVTAQQTGSLREDGRIFHALGCSRDTLKKYRGFMEATLVYTELYPYISSPLKRIVKSPKSYLTNNGLISYLTGIEDLKTLETTGLIGHRFENWALRELQTWLDRSPSRSQIYFWRTSGNVEVDLVVVHGKEVLPFEVTWSTQRDRKKVRHLRQFLQKEPKAKLGFYLYNGEFFYDANSRIVFLPAWSLG